MILLLSIVLFVAAGLLLILGTGKGTLEHRVLYLLLGFVMLIAATGNAVIYAGLSSYQVQQAAIVSNTLYANLNYTSIGLYATGNGITAYLGNASTQHLAAAGSSLYLQIPHNVYYKLNFTTANIIEIVSK